MAQKLPQPISPVAQPGNVGGDDAPIKKYLQTSQELLKSYQQLRTDQLVSGRQLAYDQRAEATRAVLEETPTELRRFSPGTQASARSAVAGQGAGEYRVRGEALARNQAATQAFLETFDRFDQQARDLYGDDLNKPPQSVLNSYKNMVEAGQMEISDIPEKHRQFVLEVLEPGNMPANLGRQKSQLELVKLAKEIEQLDILSPDKKSALLQAILNNAAPGTDIAGPFNEAMGLVQGRPAPAGGFRTDRHNNPAAFTTDIAKQAGLKLGVDYEEGDDFDNNKDGIIDGVTARLLGDPIDTTIKVIDKIGFYTQDGRPRWAYINNIPEARNWSKLSYDQKAAVVGKMYQNEGGSGQLTGAKTAGTPTSSPLAGLKPPSKEEVQAQKEQQQKNENLLNTTNEALNAIRALKTAPGKGGAIGAGFQKALGGIPGVPKGPFAGTAAASFLGELDRVKALLTLPGLEKLKGLGPASDRDVKIIADAASSLNPSMKEKDFDRELDRLEKALQSTVDRISTGVAPTATVSSEGVTSTGMRYRILQ